MLMTEGLLSNDEIYVFNQLNNTKFNGSFVFKNQFKLIKSTVVFEYGRVSSGILAEEVSFKLENCHETIIKRISY